MKLYHGTARNRRKVIKKNGFWKYTWFTTSKREARRYANSGYRQGQYNLRDKKGDVWEISIDKRRLRKAAWKYSFIDKRIVRKPTMGTSYHFFKKPPKPKLVR